MSIFSRHVTNLLPTDKPSRFLVMRSGGLGDCVLATPMIRALRNAAPNASIDVLSENPFGVEVFRNLPEVRRVIALQPRGLHRGLRGRMRLLREIRSARYDAALNLYTSPWPVWCIWAARVPLRIVRIHAYASWSRQGVYSLLATHRVPHDWLSFEMHEVEFDFKVLRPFGVEGNQTNIEPYVCVPEAARAEAAKLLTSQGWEPGQKIAVFHPGASGSRPVWPSAKFASLGDALKAEGAFVVITGSAADGSLPQEAAAGMGGPCLVTDGSLPPMTVAALIERASVYVSAATGPMHLAAALGVPVVNLAGQLFERNALPMWHPRGAGYIVVRSETNCPGCAPLQCHDLRRDAPCMRDLPLEPVIRAAVALMTGAFHPDRVTSRRSRAASM